jgi:hypothetical protein
MRTAALHSGKGMPITAQAACLEVCADSEPVGVLRLCVLERRDFLKVDRLRSIVRLEGQTEIECGAS